MSREQSSTLTPEQFTQAAAALGAELEPILTRHSGSLGGPAGVVTVLVQLLGSLCVATLDVAPMARPFITERLAELQLFVTTGGTRPQ